MNKLKTFDSSYFIGNSHFDENGIQNYLVFQPMYRYFKVFSITQYIAEWKSKGSSNESTKVISTSDNSLNLTFSYYDAKIRVKFTGGCLKQPKISYTHGKVVNIYIVYELGASSSNVNDPTLKNCLFGAVTNNSEIVGTPLCLGNISKDWSADNMKKAGFNAYYFSTDYKATDVDDIKDIHKYLMKKNDIV